MIGFICTTKTLIPYFHIKENLNISFILIEQVEIGNKVLLARREQYWQHQLRAFEDNGGNAMCIKKEDD